MQLTKFYVALLVALLAVNVSLQQDESSCRHDGDRRPTQRKGCRRPSRDDHFRNDGRDPDGYFRGFRRYGGYGPDFDYPRCGYGRPYPSGYGMGCGRYGHDCGDCDRNHDRDFDACGCEHANNREQRRDSTRCCDCGDNHKRDAGKRPPERQLYIPCKVVANDTGATLQRQCRHNETCTVGPVPGPRGTDWVLYYCSRPCRPNNGDMSGDDGMDQDQNRDGRPTDMMGDDVDIEAILEKVDQAYHRHCEGARRDGSGEAQPDGND